VLGLVVGTWRSGIGSPRHVTEAGPVGIVAMWIDGGRFSRSERSILLSGLQRDILWWSVTTWGRLLRLPKSWNPCFLHGHPGGG
jgi:hypothetical protein